MLRRQARVGRRGPEANKGEETKPLDMHSLTTTCILCALNAAGKANILARSGYGHETISANCKLWMPGLLTLCECCNPSPCHDDTYRHYALLASVMQRAGDWGKHDTEWCL